MIIAQDIFDTAMDFMNKRSPTGIIDPTKTARYTARSPGIITEWQNEMAESGDLYSTYEISKGKYDNLLGDRLDKIYEFIGQDIIFAASEVARAYSYEVDDEGVIYIEDYTSGWNILETITTPNTVNSMTNRKLKITPTLGATKTRIRFSGTDYYRINNVALFKYPFPSDRVPTYRPWIKVTLPDDFKSVSQIVNESPLTGYEKDSDFKWEGKKDLYVSYEFEGNKRVIYVPIPIKITNLSQTLQIDDTTATMTGAYHLASHLLLVEDPASASFFNDKFEELKRQSSKKQPAVIAQTVNVYGGDYFG